MEGNGTRVACFTSTCDVPSWMLVDASEGTPRSDKIKRPRDLSPLRLPLAGLESCINKPPKRSPLAFFPFSGASPFTPFSIFVQVFLSAETEKQSRQANPTTRVVTTTLTESVDMPLSLRIYERVSKSRQPKL